MQWHKGGTLETKGKKELTQMNGMANKEKKLPKHLFVHQCHIWSQLETIPEDDKTLSTFQQQGLANTGLLNGC